MTPEENKQIEYSKLSPQLQQKLQQWEENSPTNQQLQVLSDLATMSQEIILLMDEQAKTGKETTDQIGGVLLDMREALSALKDKEAPEQPDYAKPVVEAVKKLETALTKAIKAQKLPDMSPNIQVDAPAVSVEAPVVDLKGVEKVLRSEVPKAFREALQLIPPPPDTDFDPVIKQLKKLSEQLNSIETATRMKPQAPTTLKVTNPDGSVIGSTPTTNTDYAVEAQNDGTYDYFAFATPGTSLGSAAWKAIRVESDGTKRYADGNANFDNIATNLAGLSYT